MAITFGMSANEFWNEDPDLLWSYKLSYSDRIEIENERQNQLAWLNGLYVYNALNVCIYNSFGRKETSPVENYLDKPINFKGNRDIMVEKSPEEIRREETLRQEMIMKENFAKAQMLLKKKK